MRKLGRIWFSVSMLVLTATITSTPALVAPVHASSEADAVRGRMVEVLNEVSGLVKDNYYDPSLKGLDWKGAVEIARDRIRHADHEGEMAAAISGLLARLADSHTYFLRPGRLQPVIFGFLAKAFGNEVRVYQIMQRGPAEAAGLQLGDRIVGIEDFAVNRTLIDDEIRYFTYLDPRLTLKLTIERNGGLPQEIVLKGKQPVTSSKEFVKEYGEYEKEQRKEATREGVVPYDDGRLVYVRLPTFMVAQGEADSFLRKAKDSQALILDLRDDGGGREEILKEMAGHFLPELTQIAEGISRGKREEVFAKPKNPNLVMPMFVLVDSGSASASEILARVLQLKHRAVIMGDQTAGKVNRARLFGGMGGAIWRIPYAVAITVSRAAMPDGEELEGHGVLPDVTCVPSEENLRAGQDRCLAEALMLARKAISKAAVPGTH